jgi:hypothetical protein
MLQKNENSKRSQLSPILFFLLLFLFLWKSHFSLNVSFKSKISHDRRGFGYNGIVASENGICSQIGVDVMKNNGSAVDSAIASSICLGTVNFYASGIGGGGFMLVRSDTGEYVGIDFRYIYILLKGRSPRKGT